METRADRNNNPTAMTTDVAATGGLQFETDYVQGDPFAVGGKTYYTAHLLGDPIALSIKVIDKAGYYTSNGLPRWSYIAMPKFIWDSLTSDAKKQVIGFHYKHEGGTELASLFV